MARAKVALAPERFQPRDLVSLGDSGSKPKSRNSLENNRKLGIGHSGEDCIGAGAIQSARLAVVARLRIGNRNPAVSRRSI